MSSRTFPGIFVPGLAVGTMAGLLAPSEPAAAARCPLGQIYRPSLSICVSKDKAIAAGVYRAQAIASREAKAELTLRPKPRPQIDQAPYGALDAVPLQPVKVRAIPIVLRRELSPYGSLVAFEPVP